MCGYDVMFSITAGHMMTASTKPVFHAYTLWPAIYIMQMPVSDRTGIASSISTGS
jgi:hypothetical protein